LGSGIRNPGAAKNLFRIRDPGSQIQRSKRHRILDLGSGSATLSRSRCEFAGQKVPKKVKKQYGKGVKAFLTILV